ncbi:MAG: ABC transporter permease [Chloroflexi bacterium]|nr:ABC transporter permease [Chloroflexota bacterium]
MSAIPVYDSARLPSPIVDEAIQILKYRDLVAQLVRRDIVTRYKRSALGVAWTMLNPLGMMLVLSLAFSQVFGATRAFPAYLLSGLVAWNFFGQSTVYSMRQLVWGGSLIHHIYLPKTVFAVAALGTQLVNLVLSLIPLLVVTLLFGVNLNATLLFLPVSIVVLAAFTLGVSLFLSRIAVYFPDIAEMYEIALSAWLYLTPIIYPEQVIPQAWRWLLFDLNPMYHMIRLFRLPVYYATLPNLYDLVVPALFAFGMLAIGWVVFTTKADEFAYRI